jgi:hypothetical protein
MNLDPGMHIGLHLVLFGKNRCDNEPLISKSYTSDESRVLELRMLLELSLKSKPHKLEATPT